VNRIAERDHCCPPKIKARPKDEGNSSTKKRELRQRVVKGGGTLKGKGGGLRTLAVGESRGGDFVRGASLRQRKEPRFLRYGHYKKREKGGGWEEGKGRGLGGDCRGGEKGRSPLIFGAGKKNGKKRGGFRGLEN